MEITTKARRQTWAGRFYEIPDIGTLPSVTTILGVLNKPALLNWAAKVEREMVLKVAGELYEDLWGTPKINQLAWRTTMENRLGKEKASQKELAKAAEIGTQAHELIEWTLRTEMGQVVGPRPKAVDKAEWSFMAWEDWKKSVELKPLAVEQVIWSRTHGYAGTLDLLAEVEGVLTVIDWKTGKAVYGEAHLQNAAYRQAIREMGHGDPKQGLIVRLPKVETDPEFEVVVANSENDCLKVFIHAKSLWMWAQEGESAYQQKKAAAKVVETPAPDGQPDLTEALKASIAQVVSTKAKEKKPVEGRSHGIYAHIQATGTGFDPGPKVEVPRAVIPLP